MSEGVHSDAERRYRQARLAVLANVLNKAMSMLVVIAGAALTLPYLGPERFGLWMLLSSFLVLFSFLDMGIGKH